MKQILSCLYRGAGANFLAVFLSMALFSVNSFSSTLSSFEPDGSELYDDQETSFIDRSTDGFKWDAYDGGSSFAPSWGYLEIDKTQGALDSSSSLKLTVTGGRTNPYQKPEQTCGSKITTLSEAMLNPEDICDSAGGGFNYWFKNDDRSEGIPNAQGANRLSFYTKIPEGHVVKRHHSGEPENYTLHFGTYTRDPSKSYDSSSNLGNHFYHWININGSNKYWTKIIIDEHPQHEVGHSGEDPGDNPTAPSFNYIEGLTRFYFKSKEQIFQNPWSVSIDEFKIYYDPRPMPPKIATIAITQVGEQDFEIAFASTDEGSGSAYVNSYEIRYSNDPINDTNYNDAQIVSGGPAVTGDYERYVHAEAYDLDLSGSTVYFAIRQLDENTNSTAYAEYESRLLGSPPNSPSNLEVLFQEN